MRVPPKQAWASANGLLDLPPRVPITAQTVADRLAIQELFARYGIAHDEVNETAMSDLFTEDAILDVSLGGPPFDRLSGRDAITENFHKVAATQTDQRRHAITNIEMTFSSTHSANARAYGVVPAAEGSDIRMVVSCAYTAEAIRCPDDLWRFSRLWIGMDTYVGHAPGADERKEHAQV